MATERSTKSWRGSWTRPATSKPSASLGILPLGTANDLARACGIPLDPFAALRLAVSAAATDVDVGRANGRSFMNVATGGFGTQVTVATPNELKKILGSAAYFLTGVTHFSSIRPARTPVGARAWSGKELSSCWASATAARPAEATSFARRRC